MKSEANQDLVQWQSIFHATGRSGLRTPRPVGSTQEASCARVVAGTSHES